ncbi:hypothetical protein D9M68_395640 [compost metagenome]
MDQRPQQAVRPGKYRLDRESAWELGSLELMADHQPIESEHQVVSDTRAAVGHANPPQLIALKRGVNSCASFLILADIPTEGSSLSFGRRRRMNPYRGLIIGIRSC